MISKEDIDSLYEFDWSIKQVESHLVFGPISRHVPFWIIFLIIYTINKLYHPKNLYLAFLGILLVSWLAIFFLRKKTLRQQALLGWFFTKAIFSLYAFVFIVTSPISILRGDKEGFFFLTLGIIWLPGLEFIPRITPHQKYLTVTRAALSVLIIYVMR